MSETSTGFSSETPTGVNVANPTGDLWSHPASCIPFIKDAQQGVVVTEPRRKKVAIVGFATSTRALTPFDDNDWEIWGLNQLYRHIPRADRWFDIHANYDEHVVEGTNYVGWLLTCPIPVYMDEHRPRYPTSVRYPIEDVLAFFGGQDYFTSTIALMLALAVREGFREIAIFGVDLIVGTEWETQRQCVEYYIGWARGMGVRVLVPENSSLLSQRFRYGYQVKPSDLIAEDDFSLRGERVKERRDKLQLQLALLDGALQEDDFWHQTYTSTEEFKTRGQRIKEKRDEIQTQLAMLDGAYQEDLYWHQLYKLRERGGEAKSSE